MPDVKLIHYLNMPIPDSNVNIEVNSTELDGLEIEWFVDNTYGFQDWVTYVDGNLNNSGGSIRFKRAGV